MDAPVVSMDSAAPDDVDATGILLLNGGSHPPPLIHGPISILC